MECSSIQWRYPLVLRPTFCTFLNMIGSDRMIQNNWQDWTKYCNTFTFLSITITWTMTLKTGYECSTIDDITTSRAGAQNTCYTHTWFHWYACLLTWCIIALKCVSCTSSSWLCFFRFTFCRQAILAVTYNITQAPTLITWNLTAPRTIIIYTITSHRLTVRLSTKLVRLLITNWGMEHASPMPP